MSKIVVAILCGGRSSEHEISCISAGGGLSAIDRSQYEPVLIGISKSGKWFLLNESVPLSIKDGALPSIPESGKAVALDANGFTCEGKNLDIEIVFPLLHGPYGEDGTIQGLLEMADIAYVGSGVLASAVAMDKSFAKPIFAAAGMKVAEGIVISRDQWMRNRSACETLASGLSFPVFVKPARGGSSRGTTKVKKSAELAAAIEEGFSFDTKVMVEEAVVGREIECAVLEVDGKIITSQPGEVVIDSKFEFYDFEAKYLDGATTAIIPADIANDARTEISRQAALAFKSLGCSGLARVDFFLRQDNQIIINELNTMPGFTPTSVFPALWQQTGKSYSQVITILLESALSRKRSVIR